MDLLIEVSLPAAQGPFAAPPGTEQGMEGAFPALLDSLLASADATGRADSEGALTDTPSEGFVATAGETEAKKAEAGESAAGDVLAIAALLASFQAQPMVPDTNTLTASVAPAQALAVGGRPSVDGTDGARPTAEGAAVSALAESDGSAVAAGMVGLAVTADSDESAREAPPDSPGLQAAASAPPLEPGAAPPPEMQSPGVVRFDGNATEHDTPADVQPAPGAEMLQQLTTAQPAPSVSVDASPAAAQDATGAPQAPAPAVQVIDAVVDRIADGGGEARLRLDPPELGEIIIHVSVDGDSVRIDVQTETADAARVLRESTPGLTALFSDRGLEMADVFVGQQNLGQGNQGSNREWPGAGHEPQHGSFGALLGIEPTSDVRNHNRVRAAYNPDGAFDFRV